VGNDRLDPTRLSLNNGLHHGDYIIGPPVQPVNGTPVRNISEYIAKREGTDNFVVLKVLSLAGASGNGDHGNGASNGSSDDINQGRMLLYNELSILSLLQDQPGVIHQHGFFCERNHVILVLDCLVGHEFDKEGRYKHFENLQHYVIRQKRLAEREALEIFSSALATVDALHQKNIVHRDLKLGNMVLNTRTREVTLTNFVLSKHLVRDGDELMDQRGSLAYVSPDVLSGQPYCGKASDMWAMGVLLYTMIYGQFPFYDSDPQELFRKIKTAKYTIPR
jgi:serine/threonine-protein kinase 40